MSRAVKHDDKYNKFIKRDEEHDDDDMQDDTLQAAEMSFESSTSNDGDESNCCRRFNALLKDRRAICRIRWECVDGSEGRMSTRGRKRITN